MGTTVPEFLTAGAESGGGRPRGRLPWGGGLSSEGLQFSAAVPQRPPEEQAPGRMTWGPRLSGGDFPGGRLAGVVPLGLGGSGGAPPVSFRWRCWRETLLVLLSWSPSGARQKDGESAAESVETAARHTVWAPWETRRDQEGAAAEGVPRAPKQSPGHADTQPVLTVLPVRCSPGAQGPDERNPGASSGQQPIRISEEELCSAEGNVCKGYL